MLNVVEMIDSYTAHRLITYYHTMTNSSGLFSRVYTFFLFYCTLSVCVSLLFLCYYCGGFLFVYKKFFFSLLSKHSLSLNRFIYLLSFFFSTTFLMYWRVLNELIQTDKTISTFLFSQHFQIILDNEEWNFFYFTSSYYLVLIYIRVDCSLRWWGERNVIKL